VLGGDVDVALAAKAAGLDGQARAVADRLVQADVFAPDRQLRFVHPIVQTAVYEDLLPGERAARHLPPRGYSSRRGIRPSASPRTC
jgi:hypothetical protein